VRWPVVCADAAPVRVGGDADGHVPVLLVTGVVDGIRGGRRCAGAGTGSPGQTRPRQRRRPRSAIKHALGRRRVGLGPAERRKESRVRQQLLGKAATDRCD
jgi:hypothetical protein